MKAKVAIASLALALSAGFIAWRLARPHGPGAASHAAVVYDRSRSTTGGCEAAAGAVTEILNRNLMTRDSTLAVFVTGDISTAGEPIEIHRTSGVRVSSVIGGPRGARRHSEAIITAVAAGCGRLPATSISPVFLAVRRAVELLRASGCGPVSRCCLMIVSDGEETVEPGLILALRGRRTATGRLPRIDNDGIEVSFCGLAETRGPRDSRRRHAATPARNARRADQLRDTWVAVFTHPDLVRWSPTCPRRPSIVGKDER